MIALSSNTNYALLGTLFIIGSLLIGFASACFCIEFQRVFGTLGTQYVLYIGCLAVVLSCVVLIFFMFLPREASYVLFAFIPIVSTLCLIKTTKRIAVQTFYTHGLSAKLIIPRKLLVTSTLHGLSIGVLIGFIPTLRFADELSLQGLIAIILGAALLFALSILVKMDYNHLLYQVGFPLVALGALCLVCFANVPLLGTTIQLAGFSFIHLVMWGVCTYFIKNLNLPATWVIGVSTCGFMLGQLAGALVSLASTQAGEGFFSSHNLAAMILFITLFASLLMMSSTNLRTGWGLARLDFSEQAEQETEPAVEGLIAEFMLTERQTSILLLLIRGRNRRIISKELFISEETVKTHIQQIYRKLNVHSRQELIDLIESRRNEVHNDVRKPLFTSREEPEEE